MEKRSTAHMIEPEVYAIYMLVLKSGISPHRAIKMWKDSGYYSSGRSTIKEIIRGKLEVYWQLHGFTRAGDNLTDPEPTINLMKRYLHKPGFFKRLFGV